MGNSAKLLLHYIHKIPYAPKKVPGEPGTCILALDGYWIILTPYQIC